MPEAPVTRLAAAIETLVRAHKTAAPAPRGLAYLGLEGASGTGFHLLDALAARGIFRKYEFVLDVGAGLGGTSRWLAARLGCEVGGTVAIQDLVRPDAARAADIPGWMPATAAERVAALERLGFVEVTLRDRTAEAPERSAQVLAARDRLLARLRRDPRCAQLVREREALAAALAGGALRVVQIVARRP